MKRVCIVDSTSPLAADVFVEVDSVSKYIAEKFKDDKPNFKIYHGKKSGDCEVTPQPNMQSIAEFEKLQGDFYVIAYPSEPISAAVWALYAIMATSIAFSVYTYMTMPKFKVSAAQSSNNDLASRQNQARLGGRVPEFFGYGEIVPDLIAAPFTYYDEEYREIEECLMLATRGHIKVTSCRDDSTDVSDIAGAAVSVYDPNTSIVGTPILKIGEEFTEPPTFVIKSNSYNGQDLTVPNDIKTESKSIYFEYPDKIKNNGGIDFAALFAKEDSIGVYGAEYGGEDVEWSGEVGFHPNGSISIVTSAAIADPSQYRTIRITSALILITTPPAEEGEPEKTEYKDLGGTYKIASVSTSTSGSVNRYTITLSSPSIKNANWRHITKDESTLCALELMDSNNRINLNGSFVVESVTMNQIKIKNPSSDWGKLINLQGKNTSTIPAEIRLDKMSDKWVGWHSIVMPECEKLVFNFFFPNGLFYQDSKGGVWPESMQVVIEYQRINQEGHPVGSIIQATEKFERSSKSPFGTTATLDLQILGSVRVRIARTTPTKNDKTQDLCKIKDVYAAAASTITNYGDVTVVRSKTVGTDGALSLKERKLNLLAERMLKINGTGALTPTRSAAQALIHLCIDKLNGRLPISSVDINQILAVEQEVISYFKSPKAAEFTYTFDDVNLSFEEEANMIASAIFCRAFRFGQVVRLDFEKPQRIPVLLLNHRNKIQETEKRTYRRGEKTNNYDAVVIEYTSPDDDTRINYTAPEDSQANNPLNIKSSGLRTHEQAKTRAWREWNKIEYQNLSVEFDALEESNLLRLNNLVLSSDETSLASVGGEVEYHVGLRLGLSEIVPNSASMSISLQLKNGTVETISCTRVNDEVVELAKRPSLGLITDYDNVGRTKYVLNYTSSPIDQLMVLDISPNNQFENKLQLCNYTDDFYKDDHRFF